MDSKGRASANWSRSVRLARSLGRKDADEEAKSTTKSRDLNLGEYGDRLIENLTSQEARDTSPASPNALLSVLLVKREVPEKLLTKFWSIEHPAQAAQLSARRKRHVQHKAISHKQMAIEAGYPDNCRSIFGLPMLADDSRYYVYWSSLIVLIDATYTSLWVPVSAAFESAHFITSSTGALDFSMGVIFLMDLLMRFHMPIRLTGAFLGTTLHRGPVVARFYVLHGSFLVDFLAAVPLVILPVVEGADRAVIFVLILRILRLLRVQRIISMMSNVQLMSVNGASGWRMVIGQALSTLYTIVVMVNLSACLWYFTGRTSLEEDGDGWLNQEYKFNGLVNQERCDSYLAELEADGKQDIAERLDCSALYFAEGGDLKLWSISVYYVVVTLTTVGYGDITPSSMAEVWISMVIMIFGLALFASILGNIADIVATGSRRARQAAAIRSKLTDVQQWMEDRSLSVPTRREVLRYFAEDWKLVHDEQAEILDELPADVAGQAIWDLVAVDFQALPLFTPLRTLSSTGAGDASSGTHAMRALTAKMRPMSTSRGTMVCSQGEAADAVFFLQRGEIDVMHLTSRVTTITAPAVFGEASLLSNTLDAAKKRLSGYRTTLTSMIWKLDIADVDSLKPVVPDLEDRLLLGVKKTIFEKLRVLSTSQLELILLFLKQMQGSAMNFQRIEKMMPRMFDAVDMAVVQILAHYDRTQFQSFHAGMSTAKSSVIASPRHAAAAAGIGFMPHCVSPEQAASGALADGHSPSASRPHSHPGTPPSAAAGIDAAAAVWDAMPDGKASAPSADPPSEVSGMEVVGGPAADDAAAAAVDNEDEAQVMAEFEAKAAAIEVDKKKEEDKRNQAASETSGAVRPAVVAADHVEIEVPEGAVKAAEAGDDPMALNKAEAFGSADKELSFAGDVSTVQQASSGGSAEVALREEEVRGRVNFKSFSFSHPPQPHPHGQAPHLQKVAEEANGQLMDEMTRVPTTQLHGGATSVSSVIPGLENMSGTQMIHAILADKERGDAAAA